MHSRHIYVYVNHVVKVKQTKVFLIHVLQIVVGIAHLSINRTSEENKNSSSLPSFNLILNHETRKEIAFINSCKDNRKLIKYSGKVSPKALSCPNKYLVSFKKHQKSSYKKGSINTILINNKMCVKIYNGKI